MCTNEQKTSTPFTVPLFGLFSLNYYRFDSTAPPILRCTFVMRVSHVERDVYSAEFIHTHTHEFSLRICYWWNLIHVHVKNEAKKNMKLKNAATKQMIEKFIYETIAHFLCCHWHWLAGWSTDPLKNRSPRVCVRANMHLMLFELHENK